MRAARAKRYGQDISSARKQCSLCKKSKCLSKFPEDRAISDGFAYECKKCRSKRLYLQRAPCKKIRDEARKNGCVTCGWNESLNGLEFSHINREDKLRGKDGKPIDPKDIIVPEVLLEELKKCIVECANCHQIRTTDEYETYKSDTEAAEKAQQRLKPGKDLVASEKTRRGSCLDCGLKVGTVPFSVFDFDHRDPSKKDKTIAVMVHDCYKLKKIAKEMAKCDLRCKRCHAMKTDERRRAKKGKKRRRQHVGESDNMAEERNVRQKTSHEQPTVWAQE